MKSMRYSLQSLFNIMDGESPITAIMKEKNIDFDQAFWEWVGQSGIETVMINGYSYSYERLEGIEPSPDMHRYILKTSPLQPIHIHKIWRIGKAPAGTKNTAKIITRGEYKFYDDRILLRCNMKGCYDRYKCAWYDASKEIVPWNIVPPDWNVGDEKCELFLPFIE